jgi:hypothetical protein
MAVGKTAGRPEGRAAARGLAASVCSLIMRSNSTTGISRWPHGVFTVLIVGTTLRSIVEMLTPRASAACLRL